VCREKAQRHTENESEEGLHRVCNIRWNHGVVHTTPEDCNHQAASAQHSAQGQVKVITYSSRRQVG
jgi:hypothetical protein